MIALLVAAAGLALAQEGQANEATRREAFNREFKDKSPAKRVEALRKLKELHEEKTLEALAGALRDPVVDVRKAAAEVVATCTDVAGAAIKALCAVLTNKKEDKDVRTACARALMTAHFKAEAIEALVQTIGAIGEQEKDLFKLGAECTASLNYLAVQDFGAGKEAPDKWKRWWAENKSRIVKEDADKLAFYRKSVPAKGK